MYYTNGGITIEKEYLLFDGSSFSHVTCFPTNTKTKKMFQTIARETATTDIVIDDTCSIHLALISEDELGLGYFSKYAVLHISYQNGIEKEIELWSCNSKSLQEFKELLSQYFVTPVDMDTFSGLNDDNELSLWLKFFLKGWSS